ncbi:hypothetical protein SAMN06295970_1248 [Noviherbaspirillum suwonense]|uniref:Uncharacterized protein n=1 Tax=Noviherbaspirillum suwonense TaxID=1224511 RepID=A0ABY1QNS5_9BURK|nr:hypothetical protein SAMN06295970_1248 [Noviherbaspirillum suwonense]
MIGAQRAISERIKFPNSWGVVVARVPPFSLILSLSSGEFMAFMFASLTL